MDAFDFKQTYYQELGYIATECRFGFSLDHTNESVLFPHFHYYEFVEEHELDKPNKHFLQIDELEKGKGTQFDPEVAEAMIQLIKEEMKHLKLKLQPIELEDYLEKGILEY